MVTRHQKASYKSKKAAVLTQQMGPETSSSEAHAEPARVEASMHPVGFYFSRQSWESVAGGAVSTLSQCWEQRCVGSSSVQMTGDTGAPQEPLCSLPVCLTPWVGKARGTIESGAWLQKGGSQLYSTEA